MAKHVEGVRPTDWLKWEEDDRYSRDEVTIKAGEGILPSGTFVKADGDYAVKADAGDTATGILVIEVDATDADVKGAVLVRHAHIILEGLPALGDPPADAEALAEMVKGISETIVIRTGA